MFAKISKLVAVGCFLFLMYSCSSTPELTANELIADFTKNESEAVNKYLDKTVRVKLVLQMMLFDEKGDVVLTHIDINDYFNLQFVVPKNDVQTHKLLKVGQAYVIEGICIDAAKGRGITFVNCKVKPL